MTIFKIIGLPVVEKKIFNMYDAGTWNVGILWAKLVSLTAYVGRKFMLVILKKNIFWKDISCVNVIVFSYVTQYTNKDREVGAYFYTWVNPYTIKETEILFNIYYSTW